MTIEINDNIIKQAAANKSTIKEDLENLNKEMGGNRLIESILYGMPEDFKYVSSDKSDKELWYEAKRDSGI